MSYRSKRTRAQMTEADGQVPPVTTSSPLTMKSGATSPLTMKSDATDDRWGPFCPQKTKVPAVVKAPHQQPSLKDCRSDAHVDELSTTKAPFPKTQVNPTFEKPPSGPGSRFQISHAPFPKTQVNPTFEKPPSGPGSRIQISHTFQEPAAKHDQPDRAFTTKSLISKTQATADLVARKARELPAKQLNASQKTGEKAQEGVKPSNMLWKNSTSKPDQSLTTNTLLSKTHPTVNSQDLAARKSREHSARQLDVSQKRGEQALVGGFKPAGTLSQNFIKKPDGSFTTNPVLTKTNASGNSYSYELAARKGRELSTRHLDASKKTGIEAQVGVEPHDLVWKTSTTKSDHSFTTNHRLSKTHITPNLHESANGEAQELSDVLWKNPPTNSSLVLTKSTSSTLSVSQSTCPLLPSASVGRTNNGSNFVDKSSVEHAEEVLNQQDANLTGLKTFKPKRQGVVHDWPDNIEFDESEEVLIMDGEGNISKVNELIQPHDVWCAKARYCVTFNALCQPLKKGGHILVRFIGNVSRKERFCPIRHTNWHHVPEIFKVDIVKCIREHFVIPEGNGYDKGILKRIAKSVRQYRHDLKKTFFKPTTKTREEIYQSIPGGIPLDSWINLVNYWYSDKGKKFAEYGKEARASQNHAHTTGSTSYANIRADFEEKNEREPTELEVFKQTHKRKDGSYVKDTITEEFVLDADTYIESELATNPTKPKVQIQNEAFTKLMYGEDIPKRPLGYGLGVKGSDVFGVHGLLRKEVFKSGDSSSLALQNMGKMQNTEKVQNMEKAIISLNKDKEELQTKLNETNIILTKILEGMSSGMSSPEIAQLAKSTLNSQGVTDEI